RSRARPGILGHLRGVPAPSGVRGLSWGPPAVSPETPAAPAHPEHLVVPPRLSVCRPALSRRDCAPSRALHSRTGGHSFRRRRGVSAAKSRALWFVARRG